MFVHHHKDTRFPHLELLNVFPPNACCDSLENYARKHSMNMIYTHTQLGIQLWNLELISTPIIKRIRVIRHHGDSSSVVNSETTE